MSRRAAFWIAAGTAVLVYANSIPNGFAYDDAAIVLKNERVHGLRRLPEIWTHPYWPGTAGRESGLYRPVTSTLHALDWTLWRGRPQGFHLTNALAHAAATVLLLWLLLEAFHPLAALAGALLFAVHPVHTEAVANVVGRADVWAAALGFASLACLGRPATAEQEPARPTSGALRVIAGAGLFGLALLSKEGAIVVPALLVLLDAARGGLARGVGAYLRARAPAFAALLVVAGAVVAARLAVLGSVAEAEVADAFALDASFRTRFFTMIRVWPQYVRLLLLPLDLSADYSPAVLLPARAVTPVGAVGVALALASLVLALGTWRRARWASVGILWVVLALAPVSNLLFPTGVVLAERTLYLPSAGLSFIVSWLWTRIAALPRARAWAAAYGGVLVLFAALTLARNPDWRDSAAVFNTLRRDHPESHLAHWVLAADFVRRGDPAGATRWYESAYAIWPHEYYLAVDFAGHLLRTGRPGRAAEVAQDAVRLRPERGAAWELWAAALLRLGRLDAVAALGEWAPEEIRARPAFAYVIAAALEDAGRGSASEWWARADAPESPGATWVALLEVARLQIERDDTSLARKTLVEVRRAATGDSIGLALYARLTAEVDGER